MSGSDIPLSFTYYGRDILKSRLLSIHGAKISYNGEIQSFPGCVEGNGRFELSDSAIIGRFYGEQGSYQTRLKLACSAEFSNGLSIKFRLRNWSTLRYVAVGYTSADGFEHVKIPNIRQDEWLDFSYGFSDLINKIQNSGKIKPEERIYDLRVYVSGLPHTNGSFIEIEAGGTWLENSSQRSSAAKKNKPLSNAIMEYFLTCHPETSEQARAFLLGGSCPMTAGLMLEWHSSEIAPSKLQKTGTFRYLWHACQPAMKLLVHALVNENLSALFASRDIVNSWLDTSFYQVNPDQKYTWYDHGVAERLLCLLLMQQAGLQHHFDQRFMSRLADAIFAHTQLLENEAFYACYQSSRYHNHAWFQDIALMASAVSCKKSHEANYWFKRGQQRLQDQIDHLIIRENGYAVFIENSAGYHEGIQRLIGFAAKLEQLAGHPNEGVGTVLGELEAWSMVFTYPDGRLPAQGDTLRVPNPSGESLIDACVKKPQNITVLLSDAGYFVHKEANEEYTWFIGMMATNSCQTHKHQDDTSLVFWLNGIEWLIDPSFYSHDYADEVPAFCRSAAAHNMMSLPERVYCTEPRSGRTSLEYIKQAPGEYSVRGCNCSYQGVVIHRELHCMTKNNAPYIEVTDTCELSGPIKNCDKGIQERQVISFHIGDGVALRRLPNDCKGSTVTYELSHSATQSKVYLQFPCTLQMKPCEIEEKISYSGLQFMQKIKTNILSITYPIGSEVNWKMYAF